MEKAYEEVKLAVVNEKNYLSTETLELCLEALRIVKETKHNGYTNYPTWLIAVQIDNTEELYKRYSSLLKELEDEEYFSKLGIMTQSIEADFSLEAMKCQEKLGNSVFSSMVNHCNYDLVNYREIAKAFIDSK